MAFAERLGPPGKIKFNSKNLAEDWRKWKEEFSLYVSLTVKDDEPSKLQLFKYLIGSDGREIYRRGTSFGELSDKLQIPSKAL